MDIITYLTQLNYMPKQEAVYVTMFHAYYHNKLQTIRQYPTLYTLQLKDTSLARANYKWLSQLPAHTVHTEPLRSKVLEKIHQSYEFYPSTHDVNSKISILSETPSVKDLPYFPLELKKLTKDDGSPIVYVFREKQQALSFYNNLKRLALEFIDELETTQHKKYSFNS